MDASKSSSSSSSKGLPVLFARQADATQLVLMGQVWSSIITITITYGDHTTAAALHQKDTPGTWSLM
jgi:hypothetical protein